MIRIIEEGKMNNPLKQFQNPKVLDKLSSNE